MYKLSPFCIDIDCHDLGLPLMPQLYPDCSLICQDITICSRTNHVHLHANSLQVTESQRSVSHCDPKNPFVFLHLVLNKLCEPNSNLSTHPATKSKVQ